MENRKEWVAFAIIIVVTVITVLTIKQHRSDPHGIEHAKGALPSGTSDSRRVPRPAASRRGERREPFQIFLENYPIAIIAKVIKEWIKQEKEYPTIAELTSRIEIILSKVQRRLERLEKIILTTKGGNQEND